MNLPEFGLHLPSSMRADEAVRLALTAEELGLESVWISEDLFFHGAMPTAGAVAAATRNIKLGFGVLTAFNRHPALIAMDAVSLMELAGDRLVLGLGAGVKARIDRTGVAYHHPLRAVSETVRIVRGMLSGESVELDGEIHRASRLGLDVQAPYRPQIYLASTGRLSLQQTGRIGDGLILTVMSSLEHAEWAVGTARESARAAGRPEDLPTVVYLPLSVDDDGAVARRRLKPTVAFYIRRWANIPTLSRLFTEWGPLTESEVREIAVRIERGEAPEQVIDDRLVDTYCIAGTTEDCLTRLSSYAAAGVTIAAFDHGRGGPNADEVLESICRLCMAVDSTS